MKPQSKVLQTLFLTTNVKDYLTIKSLDKQALLLTNDLPYETYKEVILPNIWRIVIIEGKSKQEQKLAKKLAYKFIDFATIKIPDKFKNLKEYIDSLGNPEYFFKRLNTALPIKFWDWEKGEPKLNLIAYLNFLQENGYYTYPDRHDKSGYMYIHIEGRVVKKIREKQEFVRNIRAFTNQWLYDRAENMKIRNKILTSSDLNERNLSQLKMKELDFDNSGRNYQNFFFKDGYMWTIRNCKIFKFHQNKLTKYIWEEDIIDAPSTIKNPPFRIIRKQEYQKLWEELNDPATELKRKNEIRKEIKDIPDSKKYDIEILDRNNYFLQFLWLTSYVYWEEAERKGYFIQPTDFWYELDEYLTDEQINEMKLHLINKITWLGYFMRDYRGPADDYGLAILDAIDLKNEELKREAAGGGKSLITKAIAQIKRTYIVSAAAEDFTTNKHRYENYQGEKVMVLDDMHKHSKIGDILTDFSNGITVNPKHKKPIELSLQESPKIIITRNYIDMEGARVDRRLGRIFVSDFFHDNKNGKYKDRRTPETYFGRMLFVSDTEEQKADLVNFFAYSYIANQEFGEINSPVDELYFYRIIKEIGEPLIEFLDIFLTDETNQGFIDAKWFYDKFKTEFKDSFSSYQRTRKYNTIRKFKQLIGKYCELKGYVYNPEEYKNDDGRIIRRSEYRFNADGSGKTADHIYIMTREKYEAQRDLPFDENMPK